MNDKMERCDAADSRMIAMFERIWAAQGRKGTFEEFMHSVANATEEDQVRRRCEEENNKPGALTGYDCPKCRNRGEIWIPAFDGKNWKETLRQCDCWRVRASIRRMKKSGLEKTLHRLSEFKVTEDFQREMLDKACEYLTADHKDGTSLFLGGAVGCGKTFICSAVCRELLHKGHEVIYMQWEKEARRLNALVNDESYASEIAVYSDAEYLYIDDLFKPHGDNDAPTTADGKRAFEIINYRYVNKLPMIISTEKHMPELLELNEATGSRLYELAKGYTVNIARKPGRNYRMKGAEVLV